MDWVLLIYQPLARRAARRVLLGRLRSRQAPEQGRFARADANRLLESAWRSYRMRRPSLPLQPTTGSTMNVRLACFTQSFFEALLAGGTERTYAIELVADAAWTIYHGWARVALVAAQLTPWRKTALGFAAVDGHRGHSEFIALRFPFNAPGYRIRSLSAHEGDVRFDVLHCPVASYFRSQGSADLCLSAWCNLDYALADMTGQKLARTKTLAGGADSCDFRIHTL